MFHRLFKRSNVTTLYQQTRFNKSDGAPMDKLRNILNTLRNTPNSEENKNKQTIQSIKITDQYKSKYKEIKHKPMPIPTELNIDSDTKDTKDTTDITNDIKIRQFVSMQDKQDKDDIIKEDHKYNIKDMKQDEIEIRQRPTSSNKLKYKNLANELNENKLNKNESIDIVFNDEISEWIYNKILEKNGLELPKPNEIMIQFPSISIQKAKDIRDNVINELIEKLPSNSFYDDGGSGLNRNEYISMNKNRFDNNDNNDNNYFHRIGDHFSNFNSFETNCNRDPFDFFAHSKSTFDGIEEFDGDFHENGINLSGLNPISWYGYNNKAYDSYFDLHEPLMQVKKLRNL